MASILGTLARHRVVSYVVVSVGLLVGTVFRAVERNSNFYSITVDLSRSSSSVLVLANFGVVLSLLVGRIFQQVFFGTLRTSELERLYDRVWYFLTESLLAWTIFRDDLDTSFGIMFGFLLFAKCFHWLLADRIEWMDQVPHPGPNWVFHLRANALFFVLWAVDIVMLALAVESIMYQMSGIILFASEYAILLASLSNCIHKYLIICYDIRRAARMGGEAAPPWEDKSMHLFYVDLLTDFLKLITYLVFFVTVLTYYGLPLNIVRDVFLTARSFIGRVRDLLRYRAATRNMDQRYPDATAEELAAMSDRTCIICRDEMQAKSAPGAPAAPVTAPAPAPAPETAPVTEGEPAPPIEASAAALVDAPLDAPTPAVVVPATTPAPPSTAGPNNTPKKLPCGHVFHFHCLRSWLERQQSCPTCRRTVLETRQPNANAPAAAPNGVAAPPQPGAVPQPPQGPRGAAAAAVGAHIQNINAQLAQLHNLNQNIADTLQRLQRQHQQNNMVPNQLQYQLPPMPMPGFNGVAPPNGVIAPPANGHAVPALPPGVDLAQFPPEIQARIRARFANPPRQPGAPQPGAVAQPPQQAPPTPTRTTPEMTEPTQSTSTPPVAPASAGPATPAEPSASTSAGTGATPATPVPPAARPAQTPEAAARAAAFEAAQRRMMALRGQSPASQLSRPGTVQPRPPSFSGAQPAGPSQPTRPVATPDDGALPTSPVSIPSPSAAEPMRGLADAPPATHTYGDRRPLSSRFPAAAATRGVVDSSALKISDSRAQHPAAIQREKAARGPQFGMSPTRPSTHGLPAAVPLYDPTHAHIPGHPMLSFQQTVNPAYVGIPQANFVRAQFPGPRNFSTEPSSPRTFVPGFTGVPGFGGESSRPTPSASNAGFLSEMPKRLTDEQLAQLDGTSRQAIEERLRVLDDVQGALQRCTDELLRMRSVLPPTNRAATARTPTTKTFTAGVAPAGKEDIQMFAESLVATFGSDKPGAELLLHEVTKNLESRLSGADGPERERLQHALDTVTAVKTARSISLPPRQDQSDIDARRLEAAIALSRPTEIRVGVEGLPPISLPGIPPMNKAEEPPSSSPSTVSDVSATTNGDLAAEETTVDAQVEHTP